MSESIKDTMRWIAVDVLDGLSVVWMYSDQPVFTRTENGGYWDLPDSTGTAFAIGNTDPGLDPEATLVELPYGIHVAAQASKPSGDLLQ